MDEGQPRHCLFMHVLRVELLVQYVMRRIVLETEAEPFLLWPRFEFGTNTGNPHAHGMAYVPDNPNFECVVADEEARTKLVEKTTQTFKDIMFAIFEPGMKQSRN